MPFSSNCETTQLGDAENWKKYNSSSSSPQKMGEKKNQESEAPRKDLLLFFIGVGIQ